ncbi:MAG: acyl-CoA dehydrogenase family protein, partial [Pseudomonadales bacterium]
MNFDFSEEQNLLRDQAVAFLNDKSPLSVTRKVLEGSAPYDPDVWRGITNLGWTATTIPEKYHGIGYGHLELCVLAEELGRSLAPTPFSSSVYLATEAIIQFGNAAQHEVWLGKLAQGQAIGCAAFTEVVGELSRKNLNASVTNGKLSGTKIMVADGDTADVAVVIARSGDSHSLFLVDLNQDGVERKVSPTIDPSRSHATVTFNCVEADLLGRQGEGLEQLNQLYDRAAVLFAFEQLGGAEAAMHQAREYALGRYAFGRPIAGFQAIKHKLAKM